ncbi:hypothetical protein C0033_11365 [Clostridium sp. chh4-2]|uniref:hypothetical protein n=1 Tax=Clostridium sp. chh4-2 TaxID=2067550 RepID=UPI000CCF37E1|nr:hypothetical protein [Clostridium sp. chh4-2]PNV61839.1 hypothetical protein C0033_11365 [Clostridium sp. chh4-2]
MKKLTVREKYLIFLAVIALLTGIGYYLMELPSEAALFQAKADNQLARTEYRTADRLLNEAEDTKQELESYHQYYMELREEFGPVLNSYELERKISYYFEKNGLNLVEAIIQDAKPVYEKEKSQEPVFYSGTINAKVTGNAQEFNNLLDELADRKDLIITSFTVNPTGGEETFNIEIVCYMMAEKSRLE